MCNFFTKELEGSCSTLVNCHSISFSILTLLIGAVFIYSYFEYGEDPENALNVSYSQFNLSGEEENSYFMGATEE